MGASGAASVAGMEDSVRSAGGGLLAIVSGGNIVGGAHNQRGENATITKTSGALSRNGGVGRGSGACISKQKTVPMLNLAGLAAYNNSEACVADF